MFLSRAFYSDKAIGCQVKSPAQLAVQLASDLEYDAPPYKAMAVATARLGQDLFYPPNVKGWDGDLAWINANTLMLRYNLPVALVRHRPQNDRQAYMGQAALDSAGKTMEPSMAPTMTQSEEDELSGPEPWNARRFFASLDFKTAGECVDKMAEHFLCVPLDPRQRAVLIEALGVPGGADAVMRGKKLKPANLVAALHLLLSTAEYQVC